MQVILDLISQVKRNILQLIEAINCVKVSLNQFMLFTFIYVYLSLFKFIYLFQNFDCVLDLDST